MMNNKEALELIIQAANDHCQEVRSGYDEGLNQELGIVPKVEKALEIWGDLESQGSLKIKQNKSTFLNLKLLPW